MKPNLLLLHGALGSSQQLEELKVKLSSTFTVHNLNFEGHGVLATSANFSIDLFVENTLNFLQKNSIEYCSIFGYSMGGYVALKLALKHPEKVKQVCTLGTKFNWSKKAAEKEIELLNPEAIASKVPKFATRLMELHGSKNWKSVVIKTALMMGELADGKAMTTTDLIKIKQPVFIGIGSKDRMVSLEESAEAATHLPNGKLIILEGLPHPIDMINGKILHDYLLNQFQNK